AGAVGHVPGPGTTPGPPPPAAAEAGAERNPPRGRRRGREAPGASATGRRPASGKRHLRYRALLRRFDVEEARILEPEHARDDVVGKILRRVVVVHDGVVEGLACERDLVLG